jgi:hypothetical protein
MPGALKLEATVGERSSQFTVNVAADSDTEFDVDMAEPVGEALSGPGADDLVAQTHTSVEPDGPIWPWIATGLGVAAIGVAVYVDQTEVRSIPDKVGTADEDENTLAEWEDATFVTWTAGITGAVLTTVGVLGFLLSSESDETPAEGSEAAALTIGVSPVGIEGILRW